eukprot:TRINITY_DN67804_c0_g1_i1.p1 TRINITY_DN67804_c0_g1~~TRINITY_DN67804_c0_g1_i1.p1  ORF type:complete len:176 (+),score=24.36 TRINITY_DN67804_c0_g1_i1:61-588(+)
MAAAKLAFGAAAVGLVVDLTYPDHCCPAQNRTWRVRVVSYEEAGNRYQVDSEGLSVVWDDEPFTDDVNLEDLHRKGLACFVREEPQTEELHIARDLEEGRQVEIRDNNVDTLKSTSTFVTIPAERWQRDDSSTGACLNLRCAYSGLEGCCVPSLARGPRRNVGRLMKRSSPVPTP